MLIEVYMTNFMITIFKRVIVGSRTLLVSLNLSSFSLFNSFVPKFRIGLLVNARYNLKLIFHSLSHFAASSTIISSSPLVLPNMKRMFYTIPSNCETT